MMNDFEPYKLPFGLALTLHILLLIVLLNDISVKPPKVRVTTAKSDIVKAVAVNSQQVQAEVKKIQQQQATKRKTAIAKQRKLDQRAKAARKARVREQARLKRLKRNIKQEKLRQQKLAKLRAKKLAQLKKQRKLEQHRLEKIKSEKKAQEQKIAREKAKLAKQRKDAIAKKKQAEVAEQQRQQAALNQVRIQTIIQKYKGLIQQAIGQRWIVPDSANKQLACRFQIRLGPGGVVLSVKLLSSSGDTVLDRSAEAAVYKASPLPVPKEPDIFTQFRVFNLTVRPETVLSAG